MSAQERTLDQYHLWMTENASSQLIRTARTVGVFTELRKGQRTHFELGENLALDPPTLLLLLDALVAIGIVEQYQEDYALSQAARLLCEYDEDLGDGLWKQLESRLSKTSASRETDDEQYYSHLAATQWIHTGAAIQAAEILNLGAEDSQGLTILDIGCGSAVWSCAMGHRDPEAQVTVVDTSDAIEAAKRTAESIRLDHRFHTIVDDPSTASLGASQYDLVLTAQRLHCLSDSDANRWLRRACDAARPGGRVVIIDLFHLPSKPTLDETLEALKLHLQTSGGKLRTLEETQTQMQETGLENIQFTFLAASRINLGMAVGHKPQ